MSVKLVIFDSPVIRPQFFYLLDYIIFQGISKCGDREKKNELGPKMYHLFIIPSKYMFVCDI